MPGQGRLVADTRQERAHACGWAQMFRGAMDEGERELGQRLLRR